MNKPTPGPWKREWGGCCGEEIYAPGNLWAVSVLGPHNDDSGEATPGFPSQADCEANAALIVAAVNSCFAINPDNPLAVAEGMGEVVEATKVLLAFIREKFPKDFEPGGNGYLCPHHRAIAAALAKLGAR